MATSTATRALAPPALETRVSRSSLLGDVPPGHAVQVLSVDVDTATRLRLAQFGVRPGVTLTVLSRTGGGGRLLGLGPSRIALDRATVARLHVAERAAA